MFLVLTLFGAARAFAMPTSQAITPNLVPREIFGNAVALNSSTFHVATIVGPSLGGLMYVAGPATVYTVVTALLIVSVAFMLSVRMPATIRSTEPASWHTVLEGLRFVRSRPVVLGAISLDLFAVLFGGATAMLPVFARDVLRDRPERARPAAHRAGDRRRGDGSTAAVFPITRSRRAVDVRRRCIVRRRDHGVRAVQQLRPVAGRAGDHSAPATWSASTSGTSLIQLETPDAIRGRVSAVNAVFIGASNELGEFESGVAAVLVRVGGFGGARRRRDDRRRRACGCACFRRCARWTGSPGPTSPASPIRSVGNRCTSTVRRPRRLPPTL